MRIGLVTSEFPPDVGGVETYAWQFATALGRHREHTVTVYCPRASKDVEPPPNVALKPILSSCRGRDWSRLRHEPIDVWHALSAPHAWLAATGRPTVVSVHGNDFLSPYALTARPNLALPVLHRVEPAVWRRFRKHWQTATTKLIVASLPRAHAIFANSHYTARILAEHVPACASRIAVTWVGVDESYFAARRAPRGPRPRLLTVSRLSEPRKNVGLVLAALATLRDRYDFEYTIVGDGAERSTLEAQVRTAGLADRVRFMGQVDAATLLRLYAAADLFVLTSSIIPGSHEGFGIVYLEAAASGVPSLAARLAGAVDAVAEGSSGWFVERAEVSDITTALDDFFAARVTFEPARCQEFARRFLWQNVTDAILRRYPRETPTRSG